MLRTAISRVAMAKRRAVPDYEFWDAKRAKSLMNLLGAKGEAQKSITA
jgi:hypothetical protein